MRLASFPLFALLIAAAPALALDPVEELTRLVREASDSPNPVMAFLQGANALPDFKVSRAEIQRALEAAGVPRSGPLRQLLGPTTSLVKRGKNLSAKRSERNVVTLPTGQRVELGREINATLNVQQNGDARIEGLEGIKVGKATGALYDLKRVQFRQEGRGQNRRQVAVLTVDTGLFGIEHNETIDLGPAGPAPTARARNDGQPRRGITDALGN